MTIEELAQGLDNIFPTAYNSFFSEQEPPFICYLDEGENVLHGDNKVTETATIVRVELYTSEKNKDAENTLKEFFNNNEIPYTKDATLFVESEGVFLCSYTVEII